MAIVYLMSFRPSVTRRTSVNTKIYASYPGILCRKSIFHLFLADVKQNRRKLKTEERLVYAQVTLDYTYKNEQLRITVLLNKSGRKYQYQERVSSKKSGNNTE